MENLIIMAVWIAVVALAVGTLIALFVSESRRKSS